jgi:hypothetical protein
MATPTISNIQDVGMPGSKSFDVTIGGANPEKVFDVKAWTCDTNQVPSDQTVVPEEAGSLGYDAGNSKWVCSVMLGCEAGRTLLVWPIERWTGTRARNDFT